MREFRFQPVTARSDVHRGNSIEKEPQRHHSTFRLSKYLLSAVLELHAGWGLFNSLHEWRPLI